VLGVGTWFVANTIAPDAMVPPNLVGFFASIIGMLMGSLSPQLLANKGHSIEASLRHAQATGGTVHARTYPHG
jgi:hypothetical protein